MLISKGSILQSSLTTRLHARRHRAVSALAAPLAALLASTLLAASAHAGLYSAAPCRGYTGAALTSASGAGWVPSGVGYGNVTDNCTNGQGALRAELWPSITVPKNASIGWHFTTPANTTIYQFVGSWTGWGRSWDGNASGYLNVSGDTFDQGTHDGGTFTSPNMIATGPMNGTQIHATVMCNTVTSCSADGWNYGWQQLNDPITILSDNIAPAAGGTFGTAVTDTKWTGTERFNYAATDQGGGLRRIKTYVDGAEVLNQDIDSNGGRCTVGSSGPGYGLIFSSPVPCKLTISTYTDTNSATLASDGPHTITYAAEDLAGNQTTLYSATKTIANHPPVNTALPVRDEALKSQFLTPFVGTPVVMADSGAWTGPGLVMSTSWLRCDKNGVSCVTIAGAGALSYTPTSADVGSTLRYRVTATNPADTVTVQSDPSGVVADPKSGSGLTDKPADGKDGANGSSGANATATNGSATSGSNGTSGSGANGANGLNALGHTFQGRVAGEANGVACPSDKATLKFEHVKGNALKLGNGKKTTAQVQLTCTTTGKAIVGAKLDIATTKTSAKAAVASDMTTDGAGHAVLRIAKGASRTVAVSYKMYADDPMARAATTLKVSVNAEVTLKANRKRLHNGQAVTLRGTLAGAEIPKRGVNLAVQWKDDKRWRPFAQIKTNKKGAFAYAYKFTRTKKTIKYHLRVQVAKGQVDYPYVATASKPIKVTVAP
jgi:hypothetical protein